MKNITIDNLNWELGRESIVLKSGCAPRVYALSDGSLIAGCERSKEIITYRSFDNAQTWMNVSTASTKPLLTCANINFYEDIESGELYCAYRAIGPQDDGYYTSLRVSVSHDLGHSWERHSIIVENLEESGNFNGVWEPYLGKINGELVCFYANDSKKYTDMQNIECRTYKNGEWSDPVIISEGEKHNSRDGMPAWTVLSDGTYACVIESSKYRDEGYPFVIQLITSADGVNWSEPVDIYIPTTKTSKAGAPGIAELPNGQIVVSFQTDEDASVKGDGTSVMKTIISDGTYPTSLTAENFSSSVNIFATPDGEASIWTGIHYHDGYLYAAAGTSKGAEIRILGIADTAVE